MIKHSLVFLLMIIFLTAQTPTDSLPAVRPDTTPTAQGEAGEFFDYRLDMEALQQQVDSLKAIVKVYQKKNTMPPVDKKLLDLIPIPENQQRIILQNGTVVVGTITGESAEEISLQTSLGRLVIRRDLVVRVDENYGVHAQVEIIGEPQVDVYPRYEIVRGIVKNTGQKRADFVRVIADLWTGTTTSAGRDSSFVAGRKIKFESGVITDTSLEPGATADFIVRVPILPGKEVEYRTQSVRWIETK